MRKCKIILLIVLIVSLFMIFLIKNNKYKDTVNYNGKTYELLEYNTDIFTYNFNNNDDAYFEVDIISPVLNKKWDMVYFNQDLFVFKDHVNAATKYYSLDSNYDWFISYEIDDKEVRVPIIFDENELDYLYDMENIKKEETMLFSDIKKFVNIVKVSKDDFIYALINLVYCYDKLYWKTEVMTDLDEEYIIPLSDSLNKKILSLLYKS